MAKIILNVDLRSGNAEQELSKIRKSIQGLGDPKGVRNIDTLRKGYANLINTIQGSEKNYKKGTFAKIAEEARRYLEEVKALNPASAEYAKESKNLDNTLKRLQADFAETKTKAKNFHGSFKDIVGGFMKFQAAAMFVMKPLQLISQGFEDLNETLVETEKRVVALRRVAGDAANATELYDLAQRYGQSFENVSEVVESFAKSGYDWAESIKAAEAALIAMNVAELDAQQSSEGLIAIMKQYHYEIEDLNYIIGVLNKTSDTAAVTTEELLIALQKTGSTAKNANISFEETVGLITALSEGTAASGQNIGNALRSLIVFTSDNKALDTFAGLSSGMEETVKNYRAGRASILDIWQGLGGELQGMNSQKGTLEDLFGGAELSADIEAQLTQITDSFAEIYGTAGNYRQNYFIALLDNIKEVTDVTENLGDVTSYSQKENEKALETYEKKVASLKAQWEELANDEQGFLAFKKGLVDVASGMLEMVEAAGGLRTVLIAVAGIMVTAFSPKVYDWFQNIITATKTTTQVMDAAHVSLLKFQTAMAGITFIATAISTIIGVINYSIQEWHQKNQEVISDWESIKTQADDLMELANAYKTLDETSQDYQETEDAIIKTLGYKAIALKNLEKGTEDYKNKIKELLETEIIYYRNRAQAAANAAKDEMGSGYKTLREEIDHESGLVQFLSKKGYSVAIENGGRVFSLRTNPNGDAFSNLTLLNNLVNDLYENGYGETDFFTEAEAARDELNKKVQTYLTNLTQAKGYALWLEKGGNISQQDVDNLVSNISSDGGVSGEYSQIIKDILIDMFDIDTTTENTSSNVKTIVSDFSQLDKDVLPEVIEKLRAARDAVKEAHDFEEKKLAVMEAEKALLEAQENRVVRILNTETGQWEWKANEKEIQNAKENLDNARKSVESAAWSEIEKLIRSGNSSNSEILGIIEKWAGAYGTGGQSFIGDITELIQKETGIVLIRPIVNKYGSPEVPLVDDNGNPILDDYGYIVYQDQSSHGGSDGTSSVLRKMLNPLADHDFASFASQNGLIFGTPSMNGIGANPVHNNHVSTDSHDRQYYIHGVPISSKVAQEYSLQELCEQMDLI